MERKLGEVFEFNGVKLETIRKDMRLRCERCYFNDFDDFCDNISCMWYERTDEEDVVFREIKE